MKKIIIAAFLGIIFNSCASIRFKGDPIPVNPNKTVTIDLDESQKKQWFLLDLFKDKVPGMSVKRAFSELIKDKEGKEVIVAVIDSGIDIEHAALNSNIWVNQKEIPENQIDDDKNGYVDDVNGWNFLGDSQNENLEYVRLQKKEENDSSIYLEYEKKRQKEISEYKNRLSNVNSIKENLSQAKKKLMSLLGTEKIDLENARAINPQTPELIEAIRVVEFAKDSGINERLIEKALKQYQDALDYHHNIDFDGRLIVGDNPDDFEDQNYGNHYVMGPLGSNNDHGTHVAGIIAANGVGVAKKVKIMSIRAVPNGDEYDKDVALAIRYAVDNGAKIINASFGKSYSPHSNWVHEAILYAAEKDVLFVHAAGNDGNNINLKQYPNFPNDFKEGKEIANNMITVGASNWNYSEELITTFSNYGDLNVDVFAPGYKIYSTVPNNSYESFDGTSMAAPNVSGVAAVLRSFYPRFSASKIKKIILESGIPMYSKLKVPSEKENHNPYYYSKTGKLVNLYNALLYASK